MELQQHPLLSALRPSGRPETVVPPRPARRWPLGLVVTLLVLLAVKLVWVSGLPLSARWARYDDGLLIRQAFTIRHGEWLGAYDLETLMKGPMYPLFIALCDLLHVPLRLAQHALHAAMCVLVVLAFRPVVRRPGVLVLPFALCLFDPLSFGTGLLAGVSREGIYPALAGIVLVSAAALVIRRDGPALVLSGWAVVLGLALGSFWLTREEGLWLLPSVALLAAAGLGMTLRARPRDLALRLGVWLLPLALWSAMVLGVCALNRAHYGVFAVNEIKLPQFTAAYGALTRVGQGEFQPYAVLPRAARMRLYELSPAFRELQPHLEGRTGKRWGACGPRKWRVKGEIFGGWFLWALRDAVRKAGRADSAPEALAYYERLAREVNAACEQGRIACGPPRASLVPPWNPRHADGLRATAKRSLSHLVGWRGFSARVPASGGTEEQLSLFRDLTGCTLTRALPVKPMPRKERRRSVARLETELEPGDELRAAWADPATSAGLRARLIGGLGSCFQRGAPVLVLAAAAAWLLHWGAWLRGRRAPLLLVTLALLLAIVVRLGLLVYIELTSFPAIHARYMAPLSPLLLLFCGLALAGCFAGASSGGVIVRSRERG